MINITCARQASVQDIHVLDCRDGQGVEIVGIRVFYALFCWVGPPYPSAVVVHEAGGLADFQIGDCGEGSARCCTRRPVHGHPSGEARFQTTNRKLGILLKCDSRLQASLRPSFWISTEARVPNLITRLSIICLSPPRDSWRIQNFQYDGASELVFREWPLLPAKGYYEWMNELILHCDIVPPLKDVFRTTSSGIR